MRKVREVYVVWNEGDAKYFWGRGLTRIKARSGLPLGMTNKRAGVTGCCGAPTLATMRPSRRWGTRLKNTPDRPCNEFGFIALNVVTASGRGNKSSVANGPGEATQRQEPVVQHQFLVLCLIVRYGKLWIIGERVAGRGDDGEGDRRHGQSFQVAEVRFTFLAGHRDLGFNGRVEVPRLLCIEGVHSGADGITVFSMT